MDRARDKEPPSHGGPEPPADFESAAERWKGVLRWKLQRLTQPAPPDPPSGTFMLARPEIACPRAAPGELRVTWVGQATVLLQLGRLNVLTDPVWSERASPVSWAGPRRLTRPGIPFDALPPIDLVLVSHDHYDHLDDATVRDLHERFGDALVWATPPGYRRWFAARGCRGVLELPWWESAELILPGGRLELTALPARHWSKRGVLGAEHRLWGSWGIAAPDGRRIYFAGDSGYFRGYRDIGRRAGPFDLLLLPIGAYEPRWFMAPAHMTPEEAVRAYVELGARGRVLGIHWGTFRLTDEDPREPPERMRQAWAREGLAAEDLLLPRHGATVKVPPLARG